MWLAKACSRGRRELARWADMASSGPGVGAGPGTGPGSASRAGVSRRAAPWMLLGWRPGCMMRACRRCLVRSRSASWRGSAPGSGRTGRRGPGRPAQAGVARSRSVHERQEDPGEGSTSFPAIRFGWEDFVGRLCISPRFQVCQEAGDGRGGRARMLVMDLDPPSRSDTVQPCAWPSVLRRPPPGGRDQNLSPTQEASLLRPDGDRRLRRRPEAEGWPLTDGMVPRPVGRVVPAMPPPVRRAELARALAGADVIHLTIPLRGVQGVVARWRRSGRIKKLVVTCHMVRRPAAGRAAWFRRIGRCSSNLLSAADVLLQFRSTTRGHRAFRGALAGRPSARRLPFGWMRTGSVPPIPGRDVRPGAVRAPP